MYRVLIIQGMLCTGSLLFKVCCVSILKVQGPYYSRYAVSLFSRYRVLIIQGMLCLYSQGTGSLLFKVCCVYSRYTGPYYSRYAVSILGTQVLIIQSMLCLF